MVMKLNENKCLYKISESFNYTGECHKTDLIYPLNLLDFQFKDITRPL